MTMKFTRSRQLSKPGSQMTRPESDVGSYHSTSKDNQMFKNFFAYRNLTKEKKEENDRNLQQFFSRTSKA
jgi:hypothetical protein